MLCTLLATALIAPPKTIGILFLGNSHTYSNDVPSMVKSLIESNGSGLHVTTKTFSCGFVEELANSQPVRQELQSGRWDAIVMQGAKLSSSHKYEYDHSGAVQLAKLAKQSGVKAYLFAEWPRRGWDESAYIMKEYREISQPSGAVIVPICHAWDALIKEYPNAPVWAADGNHAQVAGSYLAACTLALWLTPEGSKPPTWQADRIDTKLGAAIRRISGQTVEKYR